MIVISKNINRQEILWLSSKNSYVIVLIFFIIVWLSFLPALGSWASADPYGYSIGGILQTKDARAYIAGAEQLIETGEYGQWNQRRPLNTTLLSSRIVLGQHDFRNSLLLQAGIFGVSLFFVIFILWRQFGVLAAGLMFFLNFAFAAYYLPTTLSESLGISLGLISVAFFLLSVASRKRHFYYLGIFVLTLALLARTGPMFVVPLLVLYAGSFFSGKNKFSFKETIFAVAPVIFAIIFNYSLNLFYGDNTTGPHGSFHYVLYKIAVGGSHWEQAKVDFPEELKRMSSSNFADFVYTKSVDKILNDPVDVATRYLHLLFTDGVRFIYGLYGSYMYLTYPQELPKFLESLFSVSHEQLVELKERLVSMLGLLMVVILSYGAIRLIIHARRSSVVHLSILVVLGTVISIPLLFSFAGVRVFITVIPFLSLFLVILLLATRHEKSLQVFHSNELDSVDKTGSYLTAFLLLLLFLASVMPVISYGIYGEKFSTDSSEVAGFSCSSEAGELETEKLLMWIGPGIPKIEIVSDRDLPRTFSPLIRESDFVLGKQHENRLKNVEMTPGTVIFQAFDQLSKRRLYLATSTKFLMGESGYRVICARENSEEGRFPWFILNYRQL
jgi:hypothetical protein